MSFFEKLKSEKRWTKKVIMINFYHNAMVLKRHWNMRLTAKRLGISLGAVSEAIRLSKALLNYSDIENCRTREEALLWLKNHE